MSRHHIQMPAVRYTHIWSPQGGVTIARSKLPLTDEGQEQFLLGFSFVSPNEWIFDRELGRAQSRGRLEIGQS